MITASSWKRGFQRGFATMWTLIRVVIPVYLVVTLIKYTPLMGWIAGLFAPVMHVFGLPGEASLVLVLGKMLNLYAALGAISSLDLSHREITIIATMLLLSHSLPVESAVSRRTGVNGALVTVFRLALAAVSGIVLNLLL